jgi:hypothetical protein
MLAHANSICGEYAGQGYDLTLRQLYYQFVARGLLPNTVKSYEMLGNVVNRGRLAGMLDWNYISDRSRNLVSYDGFRGIPDALDSTANGHSLEKWEEQPSYVEVWVEKEALAGVISRASYEYETAYFACKGYVSQSEMWRAGRRFCRKLSEGKRVIVLHLGDHDPSGIDMTRDIIDRLELFIFTDWLDRYSTGSELYSDIRADIAAHTDWPNPLEIRRIALTMDQVQEVDPPPNPAKVTDPRARSYIAEYGDTSWELDALEPQYLEALIREHVEPIVDEEVWTETVNRQEEERRTLEALRSRWSEVESLLNGG